MLAAATATLVGAFCLVAFLLRLAYLVNFISSVVLTGFKTGAALYIASTQLPKLFGLPGGNGEFFPRIAAVALHLSATHVPSLVLGAIALTLLLVLNARWPGRPTTIAVVAAVLVAMHADPVAHLGIHIAGAIPNGLPVPSLPLALLSAPDLRAIVPVALACFVLSYVETIATARSLAEMHGDQIEPGRELLALGASNLATGTFAGMPVSGGMSQSAVNDVGGARSRFALVVTSAAVALALTSFATLFSAVPDPLLGAIVVMAAIHLIRPDELRQLWNASRHEFLLAVFAAFAVLVSGLLGGVVSAAIASLLIVLIRTSRPEIAVLGIDPVSGHYVNLAYNVGARIPEGVLAVRAFGPWYFFNANYIHDHILGLVAAGRPAPPRVVVIDFSASPVLDVQSIQTLATIDADLRARGIRVGLAHLYDETADELRRAHRFESAFASHEDIASIVARLGS